MAHAGDVLGELWLGEVGFDPELAKAFAKGEFFHVLTIAHDNALLTQ